jgi:hypothetical protein
MLVLTLAGIFSGKALAQTAGTAAITTPQANAFPEITFYLDVQDSQGNPIQHLQPTDLVVLENGNPLPVSSLEELRPGAQLALAINPGSGLAQRNSQGQSRLDDFIASLEAWARSRQGSTLDDLSLTVTNGPEIAHTDSYTRWYSTLLALQIDPATAQPNLDSLARAITLASDAAPRPGMERVVLFISDPLEEALLPALDNLATQALQQNVRIYTWTVASPGNDVSQSETRLAELASLTGGQSFTYQGNEPVPDPEQYLEALRGAYQVAYQSAVKESGSHQVVVRIQTPSGEIETSPRTYEVNLLPPQPAFVTPPLEINRNPPSVESTEVETTTSPYSTYQPTRVDLQIITSFPDERQRPIRQSTLFVNNEPIQVNNEPPYDWFTWDISQYSASAQYTLRAEVLDSLGLAGSSIDHTVQVIIDQPDQNRAGWIQKNAAILAGLAVLLAGTILGLVLLLGGKIRPRSPAAIRRARRARIDPVTQPVPVKSLPAPRKVSGWVNRLHRPQRQVSPTARAFLSRVEEGESISPTTPLPITADEITLGSDPKYAMLVIDDPSIEGLHARLTRQEDGSYRLADEGSIAGTWVNYTPIAQGGILLEHGDLVHIGRVGFRFNLRQPSGSTKSTITIIKQDEPPI